MKVRLLLIALVSAAVVAVLFAQSGPRGITLLVTNALVVTMNPAGEVLQRTSRHAFVHRTRWTRRARSFSPA